MSAFDVKADERLPDMCIQPDAPMLMAYGASTWDWHRIHYDAEAARTAGFEGPIVDGQMFGALMARQVREWAGPRARFLELSFRNRNFVVAGTSLTLQATVRSATQDGNRTRAEVITSIIDGAGNEVVSDGRTVVEISV